ncbi:hypothetical protein [Georgenia alba]|uniref:DUF4232 domain-containing protein n=1 Tax=Georgenia alba TaxID=2233858 RepID=A0ABW2QC73_9MICO
MVTTRERTRAPGRGAPGRGGPAPGKQAPGRRPRRRPSKAVIRRRRIVALVILLALVGGLVWGGVALAGLASGWVGDLLADDAETTEAPTEEDTLPPNPGRCAPADLDATLASTAAGEGTDFAMSFTNDGQDPCLLDTGSASLVLTVHSGDDRVWSSADCPAGAAEHLLLLDSGDTVDEALSWGGTRSEPGCPGNQSVAGSGTYRVEASLGGAQLRGTESSFTR